MTRLQRDALRTILGSIIAKLPPERAGNVAPAATVLEEILDDCDSLEDELRDAKEELEQWRRTYE